MRIDSNFGYEPRLRDGKSVQPKVQSGQSGAADSLMTDTDLQSTAQAYISQAQAAPGINSKAVEEARQMLKSGLLDTPDAIRRAASAMLDKMI